MRIRKQPAIDPRAIVRMRKAQSPQEPSPGEGVISGAIRAGLLPSAIVEYRFAPPRLWRFDFAWPEMKLACEVEGSVWAQGRHTRGSGFSDDAVKYNTAALLGWTVLRYTTEMCIDGTAIDELITVIAKWGGRHD
jgi:very-short-patch-repair endonuclease